MIQWLRRLEEPRPPPSQKLALPCSEFVSAWSSWDGTNPGIWNRIDSSLKRVCGRPALNGETAYYFGVFIKLSHVSTALIGLASSKVQCSPANGSSFPVGVFTVQFARLNEAGGQGPESW